MARRHTPPLLSDARRAWLRSGAAWGAGTLLGATAQAQLPNGDHPEASPVWQHLRASLFGQRPIAMAEPGQLTLEAPSRAVDAAVVPMAIRSRLPQTPQQYIQRLWLVVDANPSPLGVQLTLSPESGRADIETRLRVDAYSHVRAIAELNDGRLWMALRYVKASGGCSAPAAGDAALALANLGRMRLAPEAAPGPGQPQAVQLQVNHPNHSGMAMDQLTRQFTPAEFVRKIDITLAGKPVLGALVDFSLSENPHLRFFVQPGGGGELLARATDTEGRQFSTRAQLGVA